MMLINTARLSHAAVRGLRARGGGALVNISSLAAEFPLPFQPAYNMAKSGLTALNESLMIECAGTGVAVIDLRPGDFRTDFEGSVRRPPAGQGDARLDSADGRDEALEPIVSAVHAALARLAAAVVPMEKSLLAKLLKRQLQ